MGKKQKLGLRKAKIIEVLDWKNYLIKFLQYRIGS